MRYVLTVGLSTTYVIHDIFLLDQVSRLEHICLIRVPRLVHMWLTRITHLIHMARVPHLIHVSVCVWAPWMKWVSFVVMLLIMFIAYVVCFTKLWSVVHTSYMVMILLVHYAFCVLILHLFFLCRISCFGCCFATSIVTSALSEFKNEILLSNCHEFLFFPKTSLFFFIRLHDFRKFSLIFFPLC